MRRRGYSLKLLFLLVTLVAFLMWSVALPSLTSCVIGILAWSLAGAVFGSRWFKQSVGYGAIAGAAAVVAFILCFWPVFVCGYLFYDGPLDYFEDGFVIEVFVYPVVYIAVY